MATYNGSEYAKASASVPQLENQGVAGGKVRTMYDIFTLTGDLSLNDVIKVGRLPAGARVIGYWMKNAALGAGNLDLGWAASADGVEAASSNGFLAAVAVTSAATSSHSTQANVAGLGKLFASQVDVQVKVQTDTTATSGTIEVAIHYVVD